MIRANDILTKVFPTTKFREGYEVEEVDDFLDTLAQAYRQVEQNDGRFAVSPQEIVDKQFSATRFSDGYDPVAVDDFLDAIAADIQSRQSGSFVSDGGATAQTDPRDPDAADIAEKQLKAAIKKLKKNEASLDEVAEILEGSAAGEVEADAASEPADVEVVASPVVAASPVSLGADANRDLGGLGAYDVISKLQFARIKVRGLARDRVVVVLPDGTRYPIASIEPGDDSVTIHLGEP